MNTRHFTVGPIEVAHQIDMAELFFEFFHEDCILRPFLIVLLVWKGALFQQPMKCLCHIRTTILQSYLDENHPRLVWANRMRVENQTHSCVWMWNAVFDARNGRLLIANIDHACIAQSSAECGRNMILAWTIKSNGTSFDSDFARRILTCNKKQLPKPILFSNNVISSLKCPRL